MSVSGVVGVAECGVPPGDDEFEGEPGDELLVVALLDEERDWRSIAEKRRLIVSLLAFLL